MNRRGSALLVVLGMLAVMVVSAVAFSAYMRYSRLPSSYLRRSSASRHLVKAALAEAIDIVDRAIGNDRFPGQGDAGTIYTDLDGSSRGRNYWFERCFMGTNACVSPAQTVSTMTLEGLAYLPPPLINEARYYSRRSVSAMWHPFAFDCGRFAFSAFDVSDCLDINKMFADFGRDSSDMGRISFSYALEDASHSGYQVQPSAWDEFMEQFRDEEGRPDGSKVPLISLADFNLAANKASLIPGKTPFCRAMGQTNVRYVNDETGADSDLQRGLSIITDSWFPQTNAANATTTIDLASGKDQPLLGFGSDAPDKNDATFDRLAQQSNKFLDRFQNELSMPEVVQLYDYLDRDGVPTSLAFPTTERAPMVTGVSLEGGPLNTEVTPTEYDTPESATGTATVRYHVKTYTLKVTGNNLVVMAGVVYPFKYQRGAARSFKAQAFISVTFTKEATDQMRFNASNWATSPDWSGGADLTAQPGIYANNKPSGFWVRSAPKSFSTPAKVLTEQEALLPDIDMPLGSFTSEIASKLPANSQGLTGVQEDNCTLRVIQKQQKVMVNGVPSWNNVGNPVVEYGALPSNGALGAAEDFVANAEYRPVIQLWVRVTDPQAASSGNVVDLVPAGASDDTTPSALLSMADGSAKRPALRFSDGAAATKIVFTGTELTGGGAAEISPKAYLVDDPRFNYAPENFWAMSSISSEFKTEWFEKQRSKDRDGDIFMTTSDAGYMQSPYEIAHLLRITGLDGTSDWGCLSGSGYDGRAATSLGDTPADAAMWRTYTQYEVDGRRDAISRLGILTGSKGFRMTPYSSSRDTMMAVFANTPLDWWAASTNDQQDVSGATKQQMLSSLAEANKYTFSRHSGSQAPVDWEDLRELADKVRNSMRSGNASWEDTWDNFDWDGGNLQELLGVDMGVDLHSVDRKFLHGYWRECFANRQQLFLIFVRAEPMMMGGGALGQSPPQLGARAVALVWRDPAATRIIGSSDRPAPHRTRILFYRQFD